MSSDGGDVVDLMKAIQRRQLQTMEAAMLIGAASLTYVLECHMEGFTAFLNETDPGTQVTQPRLTEDTASSAMVLMQLSDLINGRLSRMLKEREDEVMRQH